jgi:hypothetical protein
MHMRRTSVSLPTTNKQAHDRHEKPDRYNARNAGLIARARIAWMSQTQRARWAKAAVVVCVLVALVYWLVPQEKDLYREGEWPPLGIPSRPIPSHRPSLHD